MSLAIQMQAIGGPEVMAAVDVDVPAPGPRQLQVRQTAIGVNFVDIYHRIGLYPLPQLPAVIGVEGAGVVQAVGPEVSGIEAGDRVAYAGLPPGGYAERRNLPDARVVKIPDGISDKVAGSAMLRGLTAHMLLHKIYPIQSGDFVLVHAAAGGLGQFLTRWAKRLGATVIATVGSEAKIGPAEAAGADLVLLHTASDWTNSVKRASSGLGVHLAYDGIGGDTLARTFASVRPFGVVASMGQAAGPIPPVDVSQLGRSAVSASVGRASSPIRTMQGSTGLRRPISLLRSRMVSSAPSARNIRCATPLAPTVISKAAGPPAVLSSYHEARHVYHSPDLYKATG